MWRLRLKAKGARREIGYATVPSRKINVLFVGKQMVTIPLTWPDETTVGGEGTGGQYLYKLTVPTNWKIST